MNKNLLKKLGMLLVSAITAIAMISCAAGGGGELDDGSLDDQLVMFTVRVQAGQFADATNLVTYDEQLQLLGSNGDVKEEYKAGMRALRISAMKQMNMSLDRSDKIVGMLEAVQTSAKRLVVSDEQRKMDIKEIEARGKERRAEQAIADSLKAIEDATADSLKAIEAAEVKAATAKMEAAEEKRKAEDPEIQEDLEDAVVDGPSPVDLEMGADAPVDADELMGKDVLKDEMKEAQGEDE